jgi:Zn-dependent oligopeptidase
MSEKPSECPECGSWETERVNVEWWSDQVQVTRICNDCPTQYDVMYGDPYKRGVRSFSEGE